VGTLGLDKQRLTSIRYPLAYYLSALSTLALFHSTDLKHTLCITMEQISFRLNTIKSSRKLIPNLLQPMLNITAGTNVCSDDPSTQKHFHLLNSTWMEKKKAAFSGYQKLKVWKDGLYLDKFGSIYKSFWEYEKLVNLSTSTYSLSSTTSQHLSLSSRTRTAKVPLEPIDRLSTTMSCHLLDTTMPEKFCDVRNLAIRVSELESMDLVSNPIPNLLQSSCYLNEEWWFNTGGFGEGAQGYLYRMTFYPFIFPLITLKTQCGFPYRCP
jgi:hypothetical protein